MPGGSQRHGALVAPLNQADPVCKAVQGWLARKAEQERLEQQWQDLEHRLMKARRTSGRTFAKVNLGRSKEARAMRTLMAEIKSIDEWLEEAAKAILAMRAASPAGALALIELGLAIQEPLDCEEHAWALLRSGADRLRAFLQV